MVAKKVAGWDVRSRRNVRSFSCPVDLGPVLVLFNVLNQEADGRTEDVSRTCAMVHVSAAWGCPTKQLINEHPGAMSKVGIEGRGTKWNEASAAPRHVHDTVLPKT